MAALNFKRRIRLRHGHGRQGFFKKITALAPNLTRALRRRPYRGPTLYYEDEALGVDIDKAQSWLLRIENKCDNDTMFSIGSAIDHSSRNILAAGYSFCRLENFVDYGHYERMDGYNERYYQSLMRKLITKRNSQKNTGKISVLAFTGSKMATSRQWKPLYRGLPQADTRCAPSC